LVERQKATINAQAAEILRLKGSEERYAMGNRTAKERIAELEKKIEEISRTHEGTLERQNKRIQAMEDQLRRTKELLTGNSTDDTRAESISSLPNQISDTELLAIVRDLNVNVFQVAATLAEQWEELSSEPRVDMSTIAEQRSDIFGRSYVPTLVWKALKRNPVAVNLLVQSRLCELVAQIASSWRYNRELMILRSVFRHLSASGKRGLHTTGGNKLTGTRGTRNLI
jgi:hypothetical protein